MDYKREVLIFEYFFFKPLSLDELTEYFQENGTDTKPQIVNTVYGGWRGSFWHKAQLFYQSQYKKHQDLTWLSFCQHYQIPDYESSSNLGLEYEWADWKANYQLDDHFGQYQNYIQTMSEFGGAEIDLNNLNTNNWISDNLAIYKEIDKIWFDGLINNNSEVATKLKSIPYEKYLETTHWKKVRAAMILINNAICQAQKCSTIGESWYGSNESDLQIHHLDYSNRGNERFNDLAVLCKKHHEIIHQNLKETGRPGIEIL